MGIARLVKAGWIGVSGVARQFWPDTVALSTLSTGKRVLYNGKYYTVVAKSYCVSGDVILWEETATSTGGSPTSASNRTIGTTPFTTTYTNKATIQYQNGSSSSTSASNYGWLIPIDALGAGNGVTSMESMSYLTTAAKRVRSTEWWTGDRTALASGTAQYYYTNTSGTVTKQISASSSYGFYYAYSVKGTMPVVPNSDGTYTAKI